MTTPQRRPDDVLPIEAYLESIRLGARFGVVTGVLFALLFGGLLGLTAKFLAAMPGRQPSLLLLALTAILAGALFGAFFPSTLRRNFRRTTEKVYRGEGRWAAPAPAEDYSLRLVCSWLRSPAMAVGGALYFGPDVTFVPHGVNLQRDRQAFSLRLPGLAVRTAPGNRTALQKLFLSRSAVKPRLQLVAGTQTWDFVVPRAAEARVWIADFLGLPD